MALLGGMSRPVVEAVVGMQTRERGQGWVQQPQQQEQGREGVGQRPEAGQWEGQGN